MKAVRQRAATRLSRGHKPIAGKLRSWRVSTIRKRAQHIGTVQAADHKTAEAVAIKRFDLDAEKRRRLVVSERD